METLKPHIYLGEGQDLHPDLGALLVVFHHDENKTLGAAITPSSPGRQRMAHTSPCSSWACASPLLTGCSFVDLGVRASPQKLHCDPPKLGDHCNGSQKTVSAGRSPWFPPDTHHHPPLPGRLTCAVYLRQEGQMLPMLLGQVQQHFHQAAGLTGQRGIRPLHFRCLRATAKMFRRLTTPSFGFRPMAVLPSNLLSRRMLGSDDSSICKHSQKDAACWVHGSVLCGR